jgi:hypothetical protein
MVRQCVFNISSCKADLNSCNSMLRLLSFVYKVISEDKALYIFILVCLSTSIV